MSHSMGARLSAIVLFGLGVGVAVGMACGSTAKSVETGAAAAVVDCTAPDRAKLEAQFGPTVELALQRATGVDGKIDLPSLDTIGHSLEADGWCVLEHEAAKLIAWVAGKVPTGTASAPVALDPKDLAGKVAAMRVGKFGSMQFQLGPVQ